MAHIRIYNYQDCFGCRACEVACQQAHSGRGPFIWVEQVERQPYPVSCAHCEGAPCVQACPTGAMRFLGPAWVEVQGSACIGCRYCAMACPFGVIAFNPRLRIVEKCDLCHDRRAQGLLPACVQTCPTGVIRWVDDGELVRDRRQRTAQRVAGAAAQAQRLQVLPAAGRPPS